MAVDYTPGRWASETGEWYLSCDTGGSVLLGMKDDKSTCPVIGVQKHDIPLQAAKELLEAKVFQVRIGWQDQLMYAVPARRAAEILGWLYDEDFDADQNVLVVETDWGDAEKNTVRILTIDLEFE